MQDSSFGCFFLCRFFTSLRSSGDGVLSWEDAVSGGESEASKRVDRRYASRLETNGVERGRAEDSECELNASFMGRKSSADSIVRETVFREITTYQ